MNLKYLEIMDKTDKELMELLDIAFQDAQLDAPSADFTDVVMNQIKASEEQVKFAYKPIISRNVLGVIGVLFVVLLIFLTFQLDSASSNWFSQTLSSKWMSEITMPKFELPFSRILVYTIGTMGLLVMVQTTLLKGYFDKRLA